MLISVLEPSSSSDEISLFQCSISERNPRFQMIWDQLTDFQREHHRIVLQSGPLQLPLDDVSPRKQEHTEAAVPSTITSWNTTRTNLDDLDDESDAHTTSASETEEEEEYLDLDQSSISASPPSSQTEHETSLHFDLTIVTMVEAEESTLAAESEELPLLLIVPTGMPRFEIKSTLGTLRLSSKQEWLLRFVCPDAPDLYTLRFTNHDKIACSYTLSTPVLRRELSSGRRLITRAPLFDMIEEQKQLQADSHNGMDVDQVKTNHRFLRMQATEPVTQIRSSLRSDLQWSFQMSTPLYCLDKELWMHLSEKRFLKCPLDDQYASPAANFFGKEYVDSCPVTKVFRGKWLSSPLSNRSLASNYALSMVHDADDARSKILVITKGNREYGWRNRLQSRNDVAFVRWEALLRPSSPGPNNTYDAHYREIVGETGLLPTKENAALTQSELCNYVHLLRYQWSLVILDDVVEGLYYKTEEDVSGSQQYSAKRDTYLHQLPLYHFVRHLQSSNLLCISDDHQARDPLSLLHIADLLQIHGQPSFMYSSLCCGVRDQHNSFLTINATLGKFIARNLIIQSSRSKHEKTMRSKIHTKMIRLQPTLYEQMARPDLVNRYTKDASLSEFDQIPSETLASILTFPDRTRLKAHRTYYESKEVHTLQDAHRLLLQQMFRTTAHSLPLLSRDGTIHNTHATCSNNNYQRNLFPEPNSLVIHFECAFCMQTEPSHSSNDFTVSSCGHFACWSCVSAWRQHQKYKSDTPDLAVPCSTCRRPLSDYSCDIIRYSPADIVTESSEIQAMRQLRKRRCVGLNVSVPPAHLSQETGAKMQSLAKILCQKDLYNRKTVLFTKHKSVSISLENYLYRANIKAVRYMGTRKERADIAHKFQLPSGSLRILILTTAFGFDDLDLSQSVDNLIMIDNCYDTVEEQESVENKLLQHIHLPSRMKDLYITRLILEESKEESNYMAYKHYQESF